MSGKLRYIEYIEPVARKNRVDRSERQVREVLVVDRVELTVFDQLHQVWKFKGRHAVRFEQVGKTCDEVVDIRHVRQDIVRDGQIGRAAGRRQSLRQFDAEELLDDFEALTARCRGSTRGWLDAQTAHARARTYCSRYPSFAATSMTCECAVSPNRPTISST